jgi:hypothetical protein
MIRTTTDGWMGRKTQTTTAGWMPGKKIRIGLMLELCRMCRCFYWIDVEKCGSGKINFSLIFMQDTGITLKG